MGTMTTRSVIDELMSNSGWPLDTEYGWGDSPSAAYLALRAAIEGRA